MNRFLCALLPAVLLAPQTLTAEQEVVWTFGQGEDRAREVASSEGAEAGEGWIAPEGRTATVTTSLRRFDGQRTATGVTVEQSPVWENWEPVPNIGPANLQDAPVLLVRGPEDYWIFGRYGGGGARKGADDFTPEPATLPGFDLPLVTTRFPDQFDAPGGQKPGKGGYHAWQSRDMKSWVHHGPVTERFSKWVTSAELVDGKVLIYYDYPNDQDPHVYVDDDLTDGEPGENRGLAVDDPSHGSDAGVIRGLDGRVHCIFEDWSPINASRRSWDSPLAGHAVSPNGIDGFRIVAPAVDARTTPTGKTATYRHPHWKKEAPDRFPSNLAEYEVHEPEQEAYGDWAAICIGGRYYLFGDYDPAGGHQMSVGWFTSPSIDEPFTWCGSIGNGHPDPDVAFAEGKFWLATQQATDFTSPGPWVGTVEVRVGVDTDNDGTADQWSAWSEVRERYDHIPGFAKQVRREPARAALAGLPPGYGLQAELRLTDTTGNKSRPMVQEVRITCR